MEMKGIGGTAASVIAGCSPYKSPLQLYYEMRNELPVQQKTSVHPSSLRSFVKEQIQDLGKDVPAELFGTYVANKTKITTKE